MSLWHECMRLVAVAYEVWHPADAPPAYSHFHLFLNAVGYLRR